MKRNFESYEKLLNDSVLSQNKQVSHDKEDEAVRLCIEKIEIPVLWKINDKQAVYHVCGSSSLYNSF